MRAFIYYEDGTEVEETLVDTGDALQEDIAKKFAACTFDQELEAVRVLVQLIPGDEDYDLDFHPDDFARTLEDLD